MPSAVRNELTDPDTPSLVSSWIADPPQWIEVRQASGPDAVTPSSLMPICSWWTSGGAFVKEARRQWIEVTGTLGVLSRAGSCGLIDLAEAFEKIKRTTFRYRQDIMDQFLKESGRA
jgi:transposase InsO family protein